MAGPTTGIHYSPNPILHLGLCRVCSQHTMSQLTARGIFHAHFPMTGLVKQVGIPRFAHFNTTQRAGIF
jgi:hypothetical protein